MSAAAWVLALLEVMQLRSAGQDEEEPEEPGLPVSTWAVALVEILISVGSQIFPAASLIPDFVSSHSSLNSMAAGACFWESRGQGYAQREGEP